MRCVTLEYINLRKKRQVRIDRACCLLAAALAFLLVRNFGVTCLFKYFTGISCPTCGMSGAVLCLLKGDLHGYFSSNAFALPVGVIILMLIFPEIWKNRKFIAVIAAVLLCNTVYYAVRMAYGII